MERGCDGLALILPKKARAAEKQEDTDIEVLLGLKKEHMQRLREDRAFGVWAEIVEGDGM